jgi:hypothetical protein
VVDGRVIGVMFFEKEALIWASRRAFLVDSYTYTFGGLFYQQSERHFNTMVSSYAYLPLSRLPMYELRATHSLVASSKQPTPDLVEHGVLQQ